MSVTSTFQWFGEKVRDAVLGDIDRRLVEAGHQWLAASRALAPKRSGRLAAEEDFQVADHTLILIMGAPYDIFQEFGTRYLPPRPHVRPALHQIGRLFGGEILMDFNAPGPIPWAGIHATEGGFRLPAGLTHKQRQHVQRHLVPVSKRLHFGNVKRAKFRVRRFD